MDLELFLQAEQIPYDENIDLKKRTWIHRGGIARYFIQPDTIDLLCKLVKHLYEGHTAFKVIGHTSNLYILNTTNIDIVISTIHLNRFEEKDGQYVCECGVAIANLSKQAIAAGHAGYEGLINLPGTVASAAVNNAGCFKCGISDLLLDADVLCPDGVIRTYTKQMFAYSERSSAFKRGEQHGVILRVRLDCSRTAKKEDLHATAEANTLYRKTRQEGAKQNLGSTFPAHVMRAFYKNLPARTRMSLRVSAKFYQLIGKQRPQSVVNTIILLCSGNYMRLHRYISKHNFGCFVWRDEKADDAFVVYRSLVSRISGVADIEIEVI